MAATTGSMSGVIRRPTTYEGVWGWITTVDHKRIGVLYGASAFMFFLIGGMRGDSVVRDAAVPRAQRMLAEQESEARGRQGGGGKIFCAHFRLAIPRHQRPLRAGAREQDADAAI